MKEQLTTSNAVQKCDRGSIFRFAKNASVVSGPRASRAFTLVEMIIYVAIFSFISIVAVSGIIVTMKSFYAIRLAQNINQSATAAMERMAYEIRNAYDVDTANSTFNSAPGRLTLMTKDSVGANTTVEFYVASSTNPNPVWTSTGPTPHYYRAIAMSADGTYQTAVSANTSDYIFTSSDRGTTWTQRSSVRFYLGVAMSSDGKYQVTVVNGGYIYVSSDYGVTWAQKGITTHNYIRVAMSATGQHITAVTNGYIYRSPDYGNTWIEEGSDHYYYGIAMTSTGQYQTAIVWCGYIYKSTDYGDNWTQTSASSGCRRNIVISTNGQYQLTASGTGGKIEVSSNYGDDWTQKGTNSYYSGVAMSSDGMYQAANSSPTGGGYAYLSSDYGDTWTQSGTPQNYTGLAMSSDGAQLAATTDTTIYEYATKLYQLGMKVGGVDQGSLMVKTSNLNHFVFRPITTTNSKAVKIEMTVRDSRQDLTSTSKFYDTIILRGSLH